MTEQALRHRIGCNFASEDPVRQRSAEAFALHGIRNRRKPDATDRFSATARRELPHEDANVADLAGGRDELEFRRADGRRATFENGCERRRQDGTFVRQAERADPGGHVEHREDLGDRARAPRRAGAALLHERSPQRNQPAPDVAIDAINVGQRRDALFHANRLTS